MLGYHDNLCGRCLFRAVAWPFARLFAAGSISGQVIDGYGRLPDGWAAKIRSLRQHAPGFTQRGTSDALNLGVLLRHNVKDSRRHAVRRLTASKRTVGIQWTSGLTRTAGHFIVRGAAYRPPSTVPLPVIRDTVERGAHTDNADASSTIYSAGRPIIASKQKRSP